jgi:uroporphyrinogen decarboxylase
MKKTMTSQERVLTTLACQEPDRVPIDYSANPGIDLRLKQHFGLKLEDNEGLLQALGVDFRGIDAPYIGPKLHADIPERGILVDDWGIHRRWVEHGSGRASHPELGGPAAHPELGGGYWDYCDWPLKDASEEEVAAWPMPSPDDFDYNAVPELCKRYKGFALNGGNAGVGDVINATSMLRTMEQFLVDMITDNPPGLLIARRRNTILLEVMRRTLEAAKGQIDFLWLGEDLGTQISPMVSLKLFRKYIRPIHQTYVDLAKSFNIPVMIHTCGSSSWAYEDFIEMGVNAVDTLQPEAKNMSPEYLKKNFGGRLAFHGCISTAGPVAYGTVQDVLADCRKTLEIMMPGGGYCFAPTHMLQDNSPTENVLAMYETAHKYGVYGIPIEN